MAKKTKKTFGLFVVEESKERMLTLGNNLRIKISDVNDNVTLIDAVGLEVKFSSRAIVQAGLALTAIDRDNRFVCGFHGSFISHKRSGQKPECPKCLEAKLGSHKNNVESGNVQLEEDDA